MRMMPNTPRWLLQRGAVTHRAIAAVAVLAGWIAAVAAGAVLHLDLTAVLVAAGAVLVSVATTNVLLDLRRRECERHVTARLRQLKAADAFAIGRIRDFEADMQARVVGTDD